MIIAACNCGQAITGDDRSTVIEQTSEHLRKSPYVNVMIPVDHFALIGEADARITLTVAIEKAPIEEEAP